MMILHWTEHRPDFERWLVSHPRILLGCDFDGTLSPIVSHAAAAEMLPGARHALERLVELPGVCVVIISGRSLTDLRRKVEIPKAFYSGNHGLELLADGAESLAPGAGQGRPFLREILPQLAEMLAPVPGVWIEDKRWTASVHYRLVPEEHRALICQIVQTAMQGIPELVLREGRCVWEIRPTGVWDKGTALRWFMKHCAIPSRATAFIGDDVTDFDAFAAVPDGWACVVGEAQPTQASMRLRDPADTADLLHWIADVRLSAF
jgi:trehalose 6-phosphate phosphatase